MKKRIIAAFLSGMFIQAEQQVSPDDLLDKAARECYLKYAEHISINEPISSIDRRLCQDLFSLLVSKKNLNMPRMNRLSAQSLFDEKLKEALDHCVTLHQMNRDMTDQEKQICEKILYIMYVKLKEQYFYASTRSEHVRDD